MTHDDVIEIRPLREGESVSFDEIGVPGVRLWGPGVRVAVHEGGEITAAGISPETLKTLEVFVFASLVLSSPTYGPREVRFMRRVAGMPQGELASQLGIGLEDVRRIEKGEIALKAVVRDGAYDFLMLRRMCDLLNNLAPLHRNINRSNLERIQHHVTSSIGAEDAAPSLGEELWAAAKEKRPANIGNLIADRVLQPAAQ